LATSALEGYCKCCRKVEDESEETHAVQEYDKFRKEIIALTLADRIESFPNVSSKSTLFLLTGGT
jgi:hypothetical protein